MKTLEEKRFWGSISRTTLNEHLMLTRHENGATAPGVPDLHYIPTGEGDFRCGWLELKAVVGNVNRANRIGVEPSQHQYFRKWGPKMPIHFMVRIQKYVYIVPSKYHSELAAAICNADVSVLAELIFLESEMVNVLPSFLKEVTRI